MARFYDKVLGVLKKATEDRLNDEIQNLEPWFRKKSNILQSLNNGKFLLFYQCIACYLRTYIVKCL